MGLNGGMERPGRWTDGWIETSESSCVSGSESLCCITNKHHKSRMEAPPGPSPPQLSFPECLTLIYG